MNYLAQPVLFTKETCACGGEQRCRGSPWKVQRCLQTRWDFLLFDTKHICPPLPGKTSGQACVCVYIFLWLYKISILMSYFTGLWLLETHNYKKWVNFQLQLLVWVRPRDQQDVWLHFEWTDLDNHSLFFAYTAHKTAFCVAPLTSWQLPPHIWSNLLVYTFEMKIAWIWTNCLNLCLGCLPSESSSAGTKVLRYRSPGTRLNSILNNNLLHRFIYMFKTPATTMQASSTKFNNTLLIQKGNWMLL